MTYTIFLDVPKKDLQQIGFVFPEGLMIEGPFNVYFDNYFKKIQLDSANGLTFTFVLDNNLFRVTKRRIWSLGYAVILVRMEG